MGRCLLLPVLDGGFSPTIRHSCVLVRASRRSAIPSPLGLVRGFAHASEFLSFSSGGILYSATGLAYRDCQVENSKILVDKRLDPCLLHP